jgi:hypothetical protein
MGRRTGLSNCSIIPATIASPPQSSSMTASYARSPMCFLSSCSRVAPGTRAADPIAQGGFPLLAPTHTTLSCLCAVAALYWSTLTKRVPPTCNLNKI